MTEQKTTFVQWHRLHNGTNEYYYAQLGDQPNQPGWGSPQVALQLWTEDASGRVAIQRGIKQTGGETDMAIGTEDWLAHAGFQVLAGTIGYALPAQDSYVETELLLAANGGTGIPGPYLFSTSPVAVNARVRDGWNMRYTNVAVPRIHRIDVHAGIGVNGDYQAVVHADNGITSSGGRSGDLSVFAGGGVFYLCFHGGASLVAGTLTITNTATGQSALGAGLEFELLPHPGAGLPPTSEVHAIQDTGLALGSSPATVQYEYAFDVTAGGWTDRIDPKIINRSTTFDT